MSWLKGVLARGWQWVVFYLTIRAVSLRLAITVFRQEQLIVPQRTHAAELAFKQAMERARAEQSMLRRTHLFSAKNQTVSMPLFAPVSPASTVQKCCSTPECDTCFTTSQSETSHPHGT